jgi:hypothetical protein
MSDRRKGLGRIDAPDERDREYPMQAILPAGRPARRYRYWHHRAWRGDQGERPWCVAYAWLHWIAHGPDTSRTLGRRQAGPMPYVQPEALYCRAQQLDPWPGDCTSPRGQQYAGTSVRAGAQALQELGFIGSYHWAWDIDTVTRALLTTGPVVVGTSWYSGMSEAAGGMLRPIGQREGGHAYILDGISLDREVVRITNSWGTGWARNGSAWIALRDLEALLQDRGEAVIAAEARP